MELVVAILGPLLGGVISVTVWQIKKESEFIRTNFMAVHENVAKIEEKLDELKFDVAKEYVSRDEVTERLEFFEKEVEYELRLLGKKTE